MKRKIYFILFPVVLSFIVSASAYAQPVAESCEIYALVNTPVYGTLHAESEDVSFFVTTNPVKGELVLDEDGYYRYTPDRDRRGRDYFGYRVKDSDGNVSQEATVIIRISRRDALCG